MNRIFKIKYNHILQLNCVIFLNVISELNIVPKFLASYLKVDYKSGRRSLNK